MRASDQRDRERGEAIGARPPSPPSPASGGRDNYVATSASASSTKLTRQFQSTAVRFRALRRQAATLIHLSSAPGDAGADVFEFAFQNFIGPIGEDQGHDIQVLARHGPERLQRVHAAAVASEAYHFPIRTR